jgi:hypothetical protein
VTGAERVGDVVPLFGVSNGGERQKNREMGWALAVDGHRLKILHKATNQQQAAATEGTMKGRHNEQEARGKHDTIVFCFWEALQLNGGEKRK